MAQLTEQDKETLKLKCNLTRKRPMNENVHAVQSHASPNIELPSIHTDDCRWNSMATTLLADYLQSHQEAVTAIKTQVTDPLQCVEALSKLSLAMDRTFRALVRGTPEHSPLTIARMVLERQSEFIKERFPNHLPVFLEILEPFGQALLTDVFWQTEPSKK